MKVNRTGHLCLENMNGNKPKIFMPKWNTERCKIHVGNISMPKELAGKRFRIKLEEVED